MARPQSGETLRLLLVGESEELHDQVADVLDRYAGENLLHWVSQVALAPRRAQELLPHVILLDDAYGANEVTRTVRQIIAAAPGIPVIALVDEYAMGTARQVIMAGARVFVPKPLVADEFWATIHQLVSGPTQNTREQELASAGTVVAFVGPKGGTGRTMVAVNTALSLIKERGERVVIIDADYAAPALDVVLNLRDDTDITHLLARTSRLDSDLINNVLAVHSSGLHVLLAPPPGQLTTISLPQVQQIVGCLRQMFDWVIVDLGLPLEDTAYAFLDSASRIVMTMLPEMVGLRNTRLLVDQFHARGHSDEKLWLVLNRSTLPSGISRRDIEERLRIRIHATVPDDQALVSMSVNRGVPLMLSDERSAVARSIRSIAQQLVQEQVGALPVSSVHAEVAAAPRNPLDRWLRRASPA